MTPGRRRALAAVGLPALVCLGVAALVGALLRPGPPPRAAGSAQAAISPSDIAVWAPSPGLAEPERVVVVPASSLEDRPREPLPPLPPGTTTTDLLERYVDEVCECEDMACVAEARSRHNRQFGQAVPDRAAIDRRAAFDRATSCIREISGEDG